MFKPQSTLRDDSNLKGINLQLFADGGKDDGDDGKDDGGKNNTDPKTYTQEELEKLLQSETDKRVTEALKTSRAKWEEEYKEKLEKEKKEAERLANLSAAEKEKELLKQQQEQLEEKEKAIRLRELQLDTINVLAEEKLPVGFAEFLIKNDAETTNKNIKKFKEEWQKALSQAVDEKIKGTSPKLSQSDLGNSGVVDFMKLANEANIRKK